MATKAQRRKIFFDSHPFCCFCGGNVKATTIDHIPSRQLFALKHRPAGLEFPACDNCNQGSKGHEQVAALLARIFPDSTTEAENQELKKILKAVNKNRPGLLEEMIPTQRQKGLYKNHKNQVSGIAGVLNASGPLLNESINIFAAKMGFALHYHITEKIVPNTGGVSVQVYTNHDAFTNKIPAELFSVIGEPKTLKMGKWDVEEQFTYSYGHTHDAAMAAYFCTFRLSFAFTAWVCMDVSKFPEKIKIYKPGFLNTCHA